MIVFLPISVFRVPFEVAAGRPYSHLERLALDAIADEATELDALCAKFGIHKRIIVEVLVTLMYAGWIALDTKEDGLGNKYCITEAGKRAVDGASLDGEPLPREISMRKASISIVMERTLGHVARNSEVNWHHHSKLRDLWRNGLVLPKKHVRNAIGPALIEPILPRNPGEWIRHIGVPFSTRRGGDFAVAYADISRQEVIGLPRAWQPMLVDYILRYVGDISAAENLPTLDQAEAVPYLATDGVKRPHDDGSLRSWTISLNEVAFVVGAEEHRLAMLEFLGNIKSHCTIVSPITDGAIPEGVLSGIYDAVKRGVCVSILWSRGVGFGEQSGSWEGIALLRKLIGERDEYRNAGRVAVNEDSLESSACVLFGDLGGELCAIIGNYSWFGEKQESFAAGPVSCKVTHDGVLGAVALGLTELFQLDKRTRDCSGAIRVRNVGERMRARSVGERTEGEETLEEKNKRDRNAPDWGTSSNTRVSVVFGAQHDLVVSRDFESAQARIRLALRLCDEEILFGYIRKIHAWMGSQKSDLVVNIGDGDGGKVVRMVKAMEEEMGDSLSLEFVPSAVGGYMLLDSRAVLVSNVDWGEGGPDFSKHHALDIGLRLEGEEVVDAFRLAVDEMKDDLNVL